MSVATIPGRLSAGAGRIPRAVRIIVAIVLVLLVAGVGVLAYYESATVSDNQAAQQRETAAVAAAKTEIAQVLSYDYRHLNQDLTKASADTTGTFAGQFSVLESQYITPAATQERTVTTATVPEAAATGTSGNEVTVLVFVDQSTTNKSQSKAQRNGSQIRLTMQEVNGRWLIEQFAAL
jgi:Mce-associated membrane protein